MDFQSDAIEEPVLGSPKNLSAKNPFLSVKSI